MELVSADMAKDSRPGWVQTGLVLFGGFCSIDVVFVVARLPQGSLTILQGGELCQPIGHSRFSVPLPSWSPSSTEAGINGRKSVRRPNARTRV
jgi:hypothetical protein